MQPHPYVQGSRQTGSFAHEELPDRFKTRPVSLTTWTHEAKICTDEVVINLELLPAGTQEGDVAELRSQGQVKKTVLFVVKKPSEELCKIIPNLQVRTGIFGKIAYFLTLTI